MKKTLIFLVGLVTIVCLIDIVFDILYKDSPIIIKYIGPLHYSTCYEFILENDGELTVNVTLRDRNKEALTDIEGIRIKKHLSFTEKSLSKLLAKSAWFSIDLPFASLSDAYTVEFNYRGRTINKYYLLGNAFDFSFVCDMLLDRLADYAEIDIHDPNLYRSELAKRYDERYEQYYREQIENSQ